jgi:hypothetical protein
MPRRIYSIALTAGLILLTLVLTIPIAANASSRVLAAQTVAYQKWGTVCGGSPVTVRHGAIPSDRVAQATYNYGSLGPDNSAGYYNCRIVVGLKLTLVWSDFCTMLVHEYGHLAGWRAPLGQEYMRQAPDGTFSIDHLHSRNPRSLMFARLINVYPRCKGRQPAAGVTSSELVGEPTLTLRLVLSQNLLARGWWIRKPMQIPLQTGA